jgi:Zn-dependent peptidase ImmA (M78 family)
MSRPDHSSISTDDYELIRRSADRLLREAGALGRFPTPVEDILKAARLSVEKQASLDQGFLKRMYGKAKGEIRRAIDKVIGLFDSRDRMIYLDLTVKKERQRFVSLHETGHGYLPWQKDLYALLEDGEKNLDPEIEQAFEQQASVFASEVLFQLDQFQMDASSLPFELKTPMALAKRYGSSTHAAFRRFVGTSHRVCALLVFERPEYIVGKGWAFRLRQCIPSAPFEKSFRQVQWPDIFYSDENSLASRLPLEQFKRRFTKRCRIDSPLDHGSERFYLEAFDSTFNVFALVFPESELKAIKAAS